MLINTKSKDEKILKVIEKHNNFIQKFNNIKSKKFIETNDGLFSHISNILIKVEPVKFDDPIYLFQSKTKSITANKLSIFEALYDKNGNVSKGDIILETLIKEEDLITALMEENSEFFPCTFSNFNGKQLDIQNATKAISTDETIENEIDDGIGILLTRFELAQEDLEEELTKSRPSKRNIERIVNSMSTSILNLKNNFIDVIETSSDTFIKDINLFRFEVIATIEKLSYYKNAQQILLSNLKKADTSFIEWVVSGFDIEDNSIILNELKEQDNKELAESYSQYITKQINNSKIEKNMVNGAFTILKMRGDIPVCNHKKRESKVFELRIGQAKIRRGLNDSVIMNKKFLTITIPYYDLLFLLRGTKDSDSVLGTVSQFFNIDIPCLHYKDKIHETIIKKSNVNASTEEIVSQFAKIKELLNEKLNKQQKILILDELNTLARKYRIKHSEFLDKAERGNDDIKEKFKNDLEQSLNNNYSGLPNNIINESLKLLK